MPNSIVVVREVWDTRDLIGPVVDGGAIKEGILATRFEPEDLNALEMALRIKDKCGGTVRALSLGEPRQVDVLRECLYRGADGAVRVADPLFEGLDTMATAYVLAEAIRRMGDFDLILCGVDVVEGENSMLAGHIAGLLNLPLVTYVDDFESVSDDGIVCKRAVEMGYEYVEVNFPAVLSVGVALLKDDPRAPRSARAALKLKHKKTPIPTWSASDLGIGDPKELKAVSIEGYEPIPERAVEAKEVDPEDESALKQMLEEILEAIKS